MDLDVYSILFLDLFFFFLCNEKPRLQSSISLHYIWYKSLWHCVRDDRSRLTVFGKRFTETVRVGSFEHRVFCSSGCSVFCSWESIWRHKKLHHNKQKFQCRHCNISVAFKVYQNTFPLLIHVSVKKYFVHVSTFKYLRGQNVLCLNLVNTG